MKNYLFLIVLCACLPVMAYQVGPSSRSNFGGDQQPVAQQTYRSFTNSNSRNWRQGVQTKPVQTSLAGSAAAEFEAPVSDEKKTVAGKQQVAQIAQPGKPATAQASASTQPSNAPAMNANMDPTAVMQQMQGMMQSMQSTMGANAPQQPAAAGSQQGGAVMPTIPGMPDLSALMGGGAAPAAPAKK